MLERILCIVIGYCFGLFQTGYIYGRLHGIDIRTQGSGNAGTTNALRTLGKKAGAITFLGDVLKCAIAIGVGYLLVGRLHPEIATVLKFYTGVGVIVGHNYPFYLKFKGGKGIAASGGMMLGLHPFFALLGIITFASAFTLTHYVSVGSLFMYASFLIEVVVFGQLGYFHIPAEQLTEIYIIIALLTAEAYYKHIPNIKRLIHKEEGKIYLFKKPDND